MLTLEIMQQMWPHGDAKVPGLLEGIAAAAPTVFPKYGLNSDLVIAHAMAQFSHECGAGLELTENIRYTAARACQVWPSRFQDVDDVYRKVGSFAGDPAFPIKLIDNVYGNRMGNRPGTHDGSTFIGRGLSQVTGRAGYTALGQKVNLDLIADPELVNTGKNALECGVADFILCGCLPFAEQDDVDGVTFHLNGGHIGLAERKAWLKKWKTALGSASPVMHGTAWIQKSLNVLGAEPQLDADGSFGPLTAAAVKAFQASHGLEVDGKVGPQTIAAIEQALPGS
ncbi:MAG: putative chitinase [Bradyrhizobium sp.]|jgi:putative chitinase|nr:putative chitinase [Bradyrhizobium sp.]